MKTGHGARWICAMVAVWFAAGCAAPAPTTVEKRGLTYRVEVNSLILDNHIRVTERTVQRTNDLLDVQVRGENVGGRDIQLEYRFVWLDPNGVVADVATSAWQPLALSVGETAFMSGIAASPDATDFLLTVRFVGRSTRW